MPSAIDPTQPPSLNPTTAAMRANMLAAKNEIEALQTGVLPTNEIGATLAVTNHENAASVVRNLLVSPRKIKGSTDATLLWIGSNFGASLPDLIVNDTPSKTESLALVPVIQATASVNRINGAYIHQTIMADGTPRVVNQLFGLEIAKPNIQPNITSALVAGIYIDGMQDARFTEAWAIYTPDRIKCQSVVNSDNQLFFGGFTAANAKIFFNGAEFKFWAADSSARFPIECGKLNSYANAIRVNNSQTPASATAAGTTGDIAWDANYVYVCIATNTWKRTPLVTW